MIYLTRSVLCDASLMAVAKWLATHVLLSRNVAPRQGGERSHIRMGPTWELSKSSIEYHLSVRSSNGLSGNRWGKKMTFLRSAEIPFEIPVGKLPTGPVRTHPPLLGNSFLKCRLKWPRLSRTAWDLLYFTWRIDSENEFCWNGRRCCPKIPFTKQGV